MALVTIKDLSAYLTVKESTLYSWVHNGTIPFHKLNGLIRFDLDEIKSWVEASKPTSTDSIGSLKKKARRRKSKGSSGSLLIAPRVLAIICLTGNQANIKVSGRRFNGTVQTRPSLVDVFYV